MGKEELPSQQPEESLAQPEVVPTVFRPLVVSRQARTGSGSWFPAHPILALGPGRWGASYQFSWQGSLSRFLVRLQCAPCQAQESGEG